MFSIIMTNFGQKMQLASEYTRHAAYELYGIEFLV
jgi:hypothetical protein